MSLQYHDHHDRPNFRGRALDAHANLLVRQIVEKITSPMHSTIYVYTIVIKIVIIVRSDQNVTYQKILERKKESQENSRKFQLRKLFVWSKFDYTITETRIHRIC